jgi:Leucine-rich repeat (LRR) protein
MIFLHVSLISSIPAEIGLLKKLKYLDLSSNGLSGQVPELFHLEQLTYLDLSMQKHSLNTCISIDGREVETFYTMGDRSSGISNGGLKGNILEGIGQLERLEEINLAQNSFSGSIGTDIQNLKQLG